MNDPERAERAKDALALAEFRMERMNAGDPKYAHCDPDELIPLRDVAQDSLSALSEVAQLKAELEQVRAENKRLTTTDRPALKRIYDRLARYRHALEQVQDDSNVGYLSVAAQHLVAAALSEAPATEGSQE